MTPRWFTVLLSLFLAVPLCCCGWHSLQKPAAVAEEAMGCPMCQAAAASDDADDAGCPCMRELVQRDLAPKISTLSAPQPTFACLPETLTGLVVTRSWAREAVISFPLALQNTGPPRLYLRHHALLC
jgi:hypothetical protein